MMACQAVVSAVYIAIGCVVYYFCGSYVASPALGSAGVMIKKIAYGIALPGLIVSMTLYVHVSVVRKSRDLAALSLTYCFIASWEICFHPSSPQL